MKEAGTNSNQGQSAPSPDEEPEEKKVEKDMKGLVYQGGEPPQPSDIYQGGEAAPGSGEAKPEKGDAQPSEGDNILTFTEKDSRGKVVLLVAIVIIIIAVVVYVALNTKLLSTSPIKTSTTTVVARSSNSPSTTSIRPNTNKTIIVNLDMLYQYSGPTSVNGTSCGKKSFSVVQSFSYTVAASTAFLYSLTQQSSSKCPLTITKAIATTPGFSVPMTTPALPISIPPGSNVYFIMTISTPAVNYTGPLSLTIDES